jgi:hypothetical protein
VSDKKWKNRIVRTGEQPAGEFLANPGNWRIHPKNQRDALRGVLGEVGWVTGVIVNRTTGHMLDGHARVEEALKLGDETPVPFIEVELTEAEEKTVLATFDPISAMAAADKEQLDALLKDVSTASEGVQSMLADLAKDNGIDYGSQIGGTLEDAEPQIDKAAELARSTSAEDVARLMQGERADMVNIDPPYGVGYSGQSESMYYGKDKRGVAREKLKGDATIVDSVALLEKSVPLFAADIYFVWHAPQFHSETKAVIERAGREVFAVIVWNKNHANFGAMGATYKPKYEMALACKVDKIPFYGASNETTVWDFDRLSVNKIIQRKSRFLFSLAL